MSLLRITSKYMYMELSCAGCVQFNTYEINPLIMGGKECTPTLSFLLLVSVMGGRVGKNKHTIFPHSYHPASFYKGNKECRIYSFLPPLYREERVEGTQDLTQSQCLDKTMYKHILVDTV